MSDHTEPDSRLTDSEEVLDNTLDDRESTWSEGGLDGIFGELGPSENVMGAFWEDGGSLEGFEDLLAKPLPDRAERKEQNSLYASSSFQGLGFSRGHIQDLGVLAQQQPTHDDPATTPVSHDQVYCEGVLNDDDGTSAEAGMSSVSEVNVTERSQYCGLADKDATEPPYGITSTLLEGDSGFYDASPAAATEIGTGGERSPGQKRKHQESSSPLERRKKQCFSLILPGASSSLGSKIAPGSVTATDCEDSTVSADELLQHFPNFPNTGPGVSLTPTSSLTLPPMRNASAASNGTCTAQTHEHGTPTPAGPASFLEQDAMVPAPDDEGYVSYFQSSEQAKKARCEHLQKRDPDDPTIPTTNEEKEALVKILSSRFFDLSKVPVVVGERDSTAVKRINSLRADPNGARNVQMTLWDVVDTLIMREHWGLLVPPWQVKETKRGTYPNFQARFDSLCDAIQLEKSVAKRIVDLDYLHGLIDDPAFQQKRTEQNKKLNRRKGTHITLGREYEKQLTGGQLPGRGRGRKRKADVLEEFGDDSSAAAEAVAERDLVEAAPSLGAHSSGAHGLIEMQPPLQENQPLHTGQNLQYNAYNQFSHEAGQHLMTNYPQHDTTTQLFQGDRLPLDNINNLEQYGSGGYQDGSYAENNEHVTYDEDDSIGDMIHVQRWVQNPGVDFDFESSQPGPTPAPTQTSAPVPAKTGKTAKAAKATKNPAKTPKAPKNPPNKRRKPSNT